VAQLSRAGEAGKLAKLEAEAAQAGKLDEFKKVEQAAEVERTSDATQTAQANADISGGAHRDTSKPVNDGLDSHHCPAKTCYSDAPISSSDGPAIKMDPVDHQRTASYGSSPEAKAYRAEQQKLLQEGKLKEAIEMDVQDIRSKFGSKYDEALKQMQDYANSLDPNKFKNK
jgi:filamentous hemagglutinin